MKTGGLDPTIIGTDKFVNKRVYYIHSKLTEVINDISVLCGVYELIDKMNF